MRPLMITAAIAVTLATLPAGADPSVSYEAAHGYGVLINAFEPVGYGTAASESPVEISMTAGAGELIATSDEYAEPIEPGGCVDLFHVDLIDTGCGQLTIQADPLMQSTRVFGDIESTAYDYSSDPFEITERGPSVIHVDITVTGTGQITAGNNLPVIVGVCGLPPDTRGVFAAANLQKRRTGTVTGSITSDTISAPVNLAALEPIMVDLHFASAGLCV